jgi:hypothetical protein
MPPVRGFGMKLSPGLVGINNHTLARNFSPTVRVQVWNDWEAMLFSFPIDKIKMDATRHP